MFMSEGLNWLVDDFRGLSVDRLYGLLRLRSEVFVMEQDCVYQDVDGKDLLALHVQGYVGDRLAAYCRLFRRGDYLDDACIGRVVVDADFRGLGYGHELIERAIGLIGSEYGEERISLSGQLYLRRFYELHGFVARGDVYQEDGIPHLLMTRGMGLDGCKNV